MEQKTGLLLALFLAASFGQANAETQVSENSEVIESLQRIESKVDSISKSSSKVDEALIKQPLGDRKHGIEFNFFRALAWSEYKTLSGTYSRFDTQKNVEIAIPIFYQSDKTDYWSSTSTYESFTVDLHYRKFLRHNLDGFYLSGFTRFAHLSGTLLENWPQDKGSESKLGVGFGIGYRIFSATGWYWGASLSLGRYFVGEAERFDLGDVDDSDFIIDVEFFKFGYAF